MRKTVCVQGLGFVGSAMATAVALADDAQGEPIYDVFGVDLPSPAGQKRVDAINAGRFPFETSDPKLQPAVARASARGNLRATTDASVYGKADIIVVDVHLDIPFRDDEPQLQFEGFEKALRTIGQWMQPHALVIVETTVPPGTCQKVVVPVLSETFRQRGLDPADLLVAHSYERVMPGKEYLDSVINFWRVYSGHTEAAADQCEAFLSDVINVKDYPLTRLSSTTASETAKVMENTYRAANIAFICEWTRYAEKVGIDLYEVVGAIQKRPTHANIRYPGLGIGGYCLTKDPSFAPAAARQLFGLSLEFPFSRLAVTESAAMPHHGVARLTELLGGSVVGKRILMCGVSYRQDVADTRYSPSETVYRELVGKGANVDFHDPFVSWWDELDCAVPDKLPCPDDYDAVLFAIPHAEYKALDLAEWISDKNNTLVLDAYLVFSAEQRRAFRQKGVRMEAIGVGDGL
ncbi:MAG: nucleotide sugar dehydrogenase [Wenzhouxiangella sp.]|nr:nucleotide sugar dehydrogenase [Wenzhouxiangella sp.]